jgi:hypothetical protein
MLKYPGVGIYKTNGERIGVVLAKTSRCLKKHILKSKNLKVLVFNGYGSQYAKMI